MTDWMAATTRTGRLVHAAQKRQYDGGFTYGWITYCGRSVPLPEYGLWRQLDEDVLRCAICFDGVRA